MLMLSSDAIGRSASSAALIKSVISEVAGMSCDGICSPPIVICPRGLSQPEDDYMVSVMDILRCITEDEDFHKDNKRLDELMTMLTLCCLLDYHIIRTQGPPGGAFMSLEDGRALVRHFITHNITKAGFVDQLVDYSRIQTPGCIRTRNGSFARVPTESSW